MRSFLVRLRWLLVACLLVWGIHFVPFLRDGSIRLLGTPIRATRHVADSIASSFRVLGMIPTLARDNAKLQAEVNEKNAQTVELVELQHENSLLRQELNLIAPDQKKSLLSAEVISRSASVTQQSLVINKGSSEGFAKGMAIMAQGYIIGTVDDTLAHSSRIKLITSVESLLPAVLQESRSVGLLRGGPEGLQLDEIPRDVTIHPGEALVTSNIGDVIKSGLPVGRVESVLSGSSDVFQSARVVSPIDFSRLEIVFGLP